MNRKDEYIHELNTEQTYHYWKSVAFGMCADALHTLGVQKARELIENQLKALYISNTSHERYFSMRTVFESFLRELKEVERRTTHE